MLARMNRAVVLIAVVLVASACGPDDEPAPATTTTTSVPPIATTAAPPSTSPPTTAPPAVTTTLAPATTTTTTEPLPPLLGLRVDVIATDLSRPVFVTAPPGDPAIYIVLRNGTVLRADGSGIGPFLDITDVVWDNGIEQGLLGLAFHPEYDTNGRLFVYYTNIDDDRTLVEYTAAPGGGPVDTGTARELFTFVQPSETPRHYAGMLQFAPDGTLFVSSGEGAAANVHAQDPNTPFGAILRLDVDGGDPYAVPADNPFVDGGGAREVWAYGLRNPWRFSIDPVDGLVYIADVGHERWEEIDVVPLDGGGANFGWPVMEASACFSSVNCDPAGLTLPALEYAQDPACSVTGGFVYRGSAIPELVGHYFYSDWCVGFVRSFRYADGQVTDERDWSDDLGAVGQVTSFGTDAEGELYLTTWEGRVLRIVPER